jgi:acyl CoA:acetate/3-ketoacid CoA transferase beta subunit
VSLVITDLGVFEPTGHAFRVIELAPGVTHAQAADATGAPLV